MSVNYDNSGHIYIAIDLKSFYASVECMQRKLDPLTTNLVVADATRTEKTICLAVSPSLKSFGIPGRARLFEVNQKINEVNAGRRALASKHIFTGSSYNINELNSNPSLELSFIAAPPQMAVYMQISTQIYNIYLKYIAPEDIHVYSIDEVFIDVTHYLATYKTTPRKLATMMIKDVLNSTGITATAGIGTNLYLCKIAMDVVAKHIAPDKDGVRIAELDEMTYRKMLWNHQPITDFWRVGRGYAKKLKEYGMLTMGDIARCSIGRENEFYNEDLLYKLFGINAELLIDHAWGYEPVTIADIKAYKPENNSISAGQVLHCPYEHDKTRLIVKEMADLLSLDLVEKGLVTDQIVLTVGYDIDNLTDSRRKNKYKGEITTDAYGRLIPKHAHGSINLDFPTASTSIITDATMKLFDKIMDKELLSRRITLVANHVINEKIASKNTSYEQLSLFDLPQSGSFAADIADTANTVQARNTPDNHYVSVKPDLDKEKKMQEAVIQIKKKYGKNAILKGMNLEEGGTTIERNRQIGGHKA